MLPMKESLGWVYLTPMSAFLPSHLKTCEPSPFSLLPKVGA